MARTMTLVLLLAPLALAQDPAPEVCTFNELDAVMPVVPSWSKKDCPCFHHEGGSDSCPLRETRSSGQVVRDPLPPCYFLPREFLQCNEPVR